MSLASLPTLAEISAVRRATPKHEVETRLHIKGRLDADDAKKLEAWAKAVRRRDRERCRVCGVKTVRTLELDPRRGEAHHIVSKTCVATRHDPRNGVWCCLQCHQKLTRHKLFVIGTAADMFTTGRGQKYLNGDSAALRFVERNPK